KPVRVALLVVVLHQIDFLVDYLRRLRHVVLLLLVVSPKIHHKPNPVKEKDGRGAPRTKPSKACAHIFQHLRFVL
ncbi:MAG: hypothetical protein OXI82_01805, partial [Nitrospinae bacterium]|nr:hypothetical protein [Nitrospinota bacterium]